MLRRHTRSDLIRIFRERGLRANRHLGQNFLVDHNILDFICRPANLSPEDVVLEVGAGTGLLTEHLARTGAQVLAVEIDRKLFEIASEYTGAAPNVLILCADIHGPRRRVHPEVLAALDRLTHAADGARRTFKVVSNLPYCISSDLIVSLLDVNPPPQQMVLTVQAEFAARMLARPGSRDYSGLTVLLRARAKVTRLRNLPPSVFWPVPKVGSSIIQVLPEEKRLAEIRDWALFTSIVAALFTQRRKTAAKALAGFARRRIPRGRIDAALHAAGIAHGARADALRVAQIIALANALASDGRQEWNPAEPIER